MPSALPSQRSESSVAKSTRGVPRPPRSPSAGFLRFTGSGNRHGVRRFFCGIWAGRSLAGNEADRAWSRGSPPPRRFPQLLTVTSTAGDWVRTVNGPQHRAVKQPAVDLFSKPERSEEGRRNASLLGVAAPRIRQCASGRTPPD